eukprot:COSAG06_NODE_2820_length_6233_cov_12.699463_9_plen_32_part_00
MPGQTVTLLGYYIRRIVYTTKKNWADGINGS